MKKFQFKLQTLLDIRIAKEKDIQNELAKVVGLQNKERMKQDDLKTKIREQSDLFQNKLRKGKYTVAEALGYEHFVDISLRAIDTAEMRIKELEPEVQIVREKLTKASMERKVVERLKEKQYEEYMYEVQREIAKENDDINQNIFNRKKLSVV